MRKKLRTVAFKVLRDVTTGEPPRIRVPDTLTSRQKERRIRQLGAQAAERIMKAFPPEQ